MVAAGEGREGRTFVRADGQPFISYDELTYVVRVDPDGVVWLDYSDGRASWRASISQSRVLRYAAKGTWKEVTNR